VLHLSSWTWVLPFCFVPSFLLFFGPFFFFGLVLLWLFYDWQGFIISYGFMGFLDTNLLCVGDLSQVPESHCVFVVGT